MEILVRFFLIFILFDVLHFSHAVLPLLEACADWEAYKDEKCFKIFNMQQLESFENARIVCGQQEKSSSLVLIGSQEEQDFLENFLFEKNKVVNNVWLGAKYSTGKFKWEDKSEVEYSNWAKGSPRNKSDTCIEIEATEVLLGKWVDGPCSKKNLVVCQKEQTWTVERLARTMLIMRKEDDKLKNEIVGLKNNPIPVGFIYVQLSSQPDPKALWPKVEWKDITSGYAGNFLRAEGRGSAKFGEAQEESMPRMNITEVDNHSGNSWKSTKDLPINSCTGYIYTGDYIDVSNRREQSLNFCLSSEEIRPRNQAIRIWKRIK